MGTIGAVTIAFPTNEIKKVPTLFKVLFSEEKSLSKEEIIDQFVEYATFVRKEGILSLEPKLNEMDNVFLKNGIQFIVDGQNSEFIQEALHEEVNSMEERHQANALIFTQAGTYAPTLGVLGAVIGLIAALGNMNDIDALGHAIAAAFVATLMGIFSGYVLWHPFATKLKRKSKDEVQKKYLMIEGILSLQEGQSPMVLKQKLAIYLSAKERMAYLAQESETNG